MSNKIACLAWGSLVWNRGKLPVDGWETDGPRVKVEFVRQSKDGRLTLVLYAAADPVPGLWASMKTKSLDEAVDKLAEREGCDRDQIGCWPSTSGSADPPAIPGLRAWAASKGLDHVIWTRLEPKFSGRRGNAPSAEQVVKYLKDLDLEIAKKAKKYVRCTPPADRYTLPQAHRSLSRAGVGGCIRRRVRADTGVRGQRWRFDLVNADTSGQATP